MEAVVRSAVGEQRKGHVLKNQPMMVLNVLHTLTLQDVIHKDVVLGLQLSVVHMEAVVKNVEAEQRKEHVLNTHHIPVLNVVHILILQTVIQWDVVVVQVAAVLVNVQKLKQIEKIVIKHIEKHVSIILDIMVSIVKQQLLLHKKQLQVGLHVTAKKDDKRNLIIPFSLFVI